MDNIEASLGHREKVAIGSSCVARRTDAGPAFNFMLAKGFSLVGGLAMGQAFHVSKTRQKKRQITPDLTERMLEVRKLRRQVRLAEVAPRSKAARLANFTIPR